jgi:hypothetical protein
MSEHETRDQKAPASEKPQEAQRNWQMVVGAAAAAGAAGGLASDVYTDIKAAGKAIVDKIREHGSGQDAKSSTEEKGE